ncbi:MAG: helix-turn-helix domain-containing protein [Ancalomicrobiaceae bacterium]|nr:helix-turn-helix domain-containing protein [Ancalomicrobiaceae bacterium]
MLGMFNTEDTAKILGLKVETLKSYRSRGEGPEFVKQGNRVFYERDALCEYLYNERVASNGLAYVAAELADEFKTDLADWVEAAFADCTDDFEKEVAKAIAEQGLSADNEDDVDAIAETREAIETEWRDTIEENMLKFNDPSEFNEKWNERYETELRAQVEEDVDRAIGLL